MMRRFRMLLPPDWVLVFFGLSCFLALLPGILVGRRVGAVPPDAARPPQLVIGASLLLYGVYRVISFHPAYRKNYRQWLERTPWQWPRPLPVGPVQIVWEDAVIVGGLGCVVAAVAHFSLAGAATLFLAGYLAAIAPTFWMTGLKGFGYATLFILAAALALARTPERSLGIVLADSALARLALGVSMRRWPWDLTRATEAGLMLQGGQQGTTADRSLGWPHDRLAPRFPERFVAVPWLDGLLASLLPGCWLAALDYLIDDPHSAAMFGHMILGYVCMIGAMVRLGRYTTGYAPPISFWGRIVTLRWIIPSYDQVFVAPLVAILMGTAGAYWLRFIPGIRPDYACAIALSATLMSLLLGGPSLVRWRLTARARLVPGGKAGMVQAG
jgi:hypothetical protein